MTKPPTTKQLRYLRTLAQRTGTSFSPPSTAREASRAIQALKTRPASSPVEVYLDVERTLEQRDGAHTGTAIGPGEITGYGSNAHWAGR
jgi:hypothetical protein